MCKRITKFHRQSVSVPTLLQWFKMLAGSPLMKVVDDVLGYSGQSHGAAMMAHPSAVPLLIVVAIAAVGGVVCAGWHGMPRRGRAKE